MIGRTKVRGHEVRGLVETENAAKRLGDELRRIRTITIFLARGVLKMQQARRNALALPPDDCKDYLLSEFPILHGPKAEETVQRIADLPDLSAGRAETKHMGRASQRENEGWVPVTVRFPGAQPYTWSRSVLVLLDTGGIAISSYFDRQALEGQWLNLEEGFGTVTHWHELPPVPEEAEQQQVLSQLDCRQQRESRSLRKKKTIAREEQSLEAGLMSGQRRWPRAAPAPPGPEIPESAPSRQVPSAVPSSASGDEIPWI